MKKTKEMLKNEVIAEMVLRRNRNDNQVKLYDYTSIILVTVVFCLLVAMFFVQSIKIDTLINN